VSAGEDGRPDWLRFAQRVQAIAQAGLAYSEEPYDRERYEELRRIAVDMAAARLPAPGEDVRVAFASGLGYPTPKVDVRAVVFRNEELLLVRERKSSRWTFPGGWADAGDTPSHAAERETLEESGYRVRAEKLLALLDKSRHAHPPSIDYTYKVLIQCRLEGGEPRTSHEIDAVGFFARGALPDLDLDRTTPGQVDLACAHRADPARPTDFD
jgi:ADP-ribose pyrophosphatase YjhB (NUDIX family)